MTIPGLLVKKTLYVANIDVDFVSEISISVVDPLRILGDVWTKI